jgi:hypothetical protein
MSDDPQEFGFAAPPFKPDDAFARLKRDLRDAGLSERAGIFERRGVAIAKVSIDGAVLQAATVARPLRSSPQWQPRTLKSSADVRDFVTGLKHKLAGWSDRDD